MIVPLHLNCNKIHVFAIYILFCHDKKMNYIWFFIILISIISAAITGKMENLINAVLNSAQKAIEVSIYLAGIMAFWLGIMRIAEKSKLVNIISEFLSPAAKFLFPSVPKNSPVIGDIAMNFTANALTICVCLSQ